MFLSPSLSALKITDLFLCFWNFKFQNESLKFFHFSCERKLSCSKMKFSYFSNQICQRIDDKSQKFACHLQHCRLPVVLYFLHGIFWTIIFSKLRCFFFSLWRIFVWKFQAMMLVWSLSRKLNKSGDFKMQQPTNIFCNSAIGITVLSVSSATA